MTTSEKMPLEIFFKQKNEGMLKELIALNEGDLLSDTQLCKSFILKGLQRLLLVCLEKNIDVEQAMRDLEVQGSSFARDLPYSNQKCSELLKRVLNHLPEEDSQDVLEQKPVPITSGKKKDKKKQATSVHGSKQSVNKVQEVVVEENDDDLPDWSSFGGAVGLGQDL